MSKDQTIRARKRRVSMYARLMLERQWRGGLFAETFHGAVGEGMECVVILSEPSFRNELFRFIEMSFEMMNCVRGCAHNSLSQKLQTARCTPAGTRCPAIMVS